MKIAGEFRWRPFGRSRRIAKFDIPLENGSLGIIRGSYIARLSGTRRTLQNEGGYGGLVDGLERMVEEVTVERVETFNLIDQRDRLVAALKSYGRVAVAYSGGIDSTVVAKAAFEALGDETVAVTAVSDSLATGELEEAQDLAQKIGIKHRVIQPRNSRTPTIFGIIPTAATSARVSCTADSPECSDSCMSM